MFSEVAEILLGPMRLPILMLLELSWAFDTIDLSILLSRLQHKFGFDGLVLSWFKSCLTGRSLKVLVNDVLSDTFDQQWGVSQGSCLGPLLFVSLKLQVFIFLMFMFDTQLYISFSSNDIDEQLHTLSAIEDA